LGDEDIDVDGKIIKVKSKKKVMLSRYMPWRHMGEEEV
jgi:hypothetical protein